MGCTVYIATSLDGYIARPDGSVDWLEVTGPDEEDYGFAEFMAGVDALVMGRKSFEVVLSFGEWYYGTTPVIVLSSTLEAPPAGSPETVEIMKGSPGEVVGTLAERGLEHLYVDGGRTVQAFMDAGLIDRFIIARIPVVIGEGIPLFGTVASDVKLEHVTTETFDNGIVKTEYVLVRD